MAEHTTPIRLVGLHPQRDLRGTRYDRYTRVSGVRDALRKAHRMLAANDSGAPTSVRIDWLYRISSLTGQRVYKARFVVSAEGIDRLWEIDQPAVASGA